ncbi:MAG: hypothetical protein IPI39_26360 [Candidatus Obscuribacter sp.]|nr:hypothetical protein [Candidatus Obscuribacter sp.]
MPSKNILLALTLAGLLLGAWGCDGSGMSEKGNGANGGATGTTDMAGGTGAGVTGADRQGAGRQGDDRQDAGSDTDTSGPTQAFEVSFDGLTVESYVGSEPGSSYVQFKDGDKVLLKEVFDWLDCPPKLVYADRAEGPEHLPIRLAKDDVKAVIIEFSRDRVEFSRIYKVSLPQDSKDKTVRQVTRLAQIEHSCALVQAAPEQSSPQQTSPQQTSPEQYDLSVEIPSRFNGARRVMLEITLCIESGKVVVDQKAMKAEVPDASKISDFIAEASAAFSEKEEIKALIKAQAKRQKLGNSDEKSDAEAYANDPLAIVPPELADGVLHCIYAGRLDLGRKILDAAWPSGLRGKQKYWRALCAEASKGPYGEQIRLLNKGRGKFPS